jgi:hypothetical protein
MKKNQNVRLHTLLPPLKWYPCETRGRPCHAIVTFSLSYRNTCNMRKVLCFPSRRDKRLISILLDTYVNIMYIDHRMFRSIFFRILFEIIRWLAFFTRSIYRALFSYYLHRTIIFSSGRISTFRLDDFADFAITWR